MLYTFHEVVLVAVDLVDAVLAFMVVDLSVITELILLLLLYNLFKEVGP
jgi:hypothetical protein